MKIIRSRLILPINVEKYVNKAHTRNADAIVLDLEDSIPTSEKVYSRTLIKESAEKAKSGGSLIYIRVNNNDDLILDEIESSVDKNIEGVIIPKVENAKMVKELDDWIGKIESKKGIEIGTTSISILIETVTGYFNIKEILSASPRIDTVTLGVEDFAFDAGIEASVDGAELLVPKMQILLTAKMFNIMPLGIMGSMIHYKDLGGFEESSKKASEYGFVGASCIHPTQVEVLNRSFSPSKESIIEAKGIIRAFESALENKRASTEYNGKMIDYPLYEKAKKILTRKSKIDELEYKKELSRATIISER